jgi:hypothetical protein
MATIKVEKAPKSYKLNYSDCIILEKWNLTEGIKRIKDFYYDKNDETYWPFEWEDAISFLNLLDYEDKIS